LAGGQPARARCSPGALDALLDRADFAALPEVDHLHHATLAAEDVIRLDIAVGVAHLMHGPQALGGGDEGIDDLDEIRWQAHVEGFAVHQLHDEEGLADLQQHGLDDLQIEAAAQVGMSELA
jgi:hypothetical protein